MKQGHADALDVTPIWHQCHEHLEPFRDALSLAPEQRRSCPLCQSPKAFDVMADVYFGQKIQRARLAYCPECRRYGMSAGQATLVRRNAGVAPDAPVSSLNARLWSASPTFLNLEPTTRCNYSCWYCVGRHMEQADIAPENFSRLLDNFPTVQAIALVGEGEPLMHKGFFDMARMARERGVRVMTISNGSTFSTANVRKICEAGIAYISISIDSSDPATFASSRIGGDLEKVLAGIRLLTEYRDRNGYRYPRIGLKGTLFAHTEAQLPAIVDLARENGADIFESFQPLNPMRTYVPIYPREQLKELSRVGHIAAVIGRDSHYGMQRLKPVQEFCEEEGVRIDKNGQPNGMRPNCDEEWIYALLSGDVTPCCQIKTPVDADWNLFRTSIGSILGNPNYENVRFNLWNGLFPAYCAGCWKTR